MKIDNIDFSEKWNHLISQNQETQHHKIASYNKLITISIAVTFVALSVISVFIVPEFAPLLIVGSAFLMTPAVEFAKIFLARAQTSNKLEEQSQKVRKYYEKLVKQKAPYPEVTALACHWKKKAEKDYKNYQTLYQKALSKAEKKDAPTPSIRRYKMEALEAEQTAMKTKIYSLFLSSLIGRQKAFEKIFLQYGEDLSAAFADFAKWDSRDIETRVLDSYFTPKDPLLKFYIPGCGSISYQEVFNKQAEERLKRRLGQAIELSFGA